MADRTEFDCVIVGGGPAGVVAGLLLARGGMEVAVLEKHADFFRDFRGDTIHPSTLRLLDELGLYDEFAQISHRKVKNVSFLRPDGTEFVLADLTRLRVPHPFVTLAPQWDFLDLLARAGEQEPTFHLRMGAEATSLIREGGRIAGVVASTADGDVSLRAPLVIAADGRWSLVRREAGLAVRALRSTVDAWWFRVETEVEVADSIAPRAADGTVFIGIPRPGYVQIARLLPKGADARLRAEGVQSLRRAVALAFPELERDAQALTLDDVKLLDIQRNSARRWFVDGLLCIGDAVHAMSPVGGVGVNLAVQDGVAAARILAEPLRRGRVTVRDLRRVQRRRRITTTTVQLLQGALHRMIEPVVHRGGTLRPPAFVAWLFTAFPVLTVIPARLIGMGVTPEHAPDFARRPRR
ncbi:FAD-dependent oxidoreductase [Microbacterium sp. 22242]|uniref:FAD-dependent oxidoreductase n=1 Tax=Microbacterium sp. 22242 TaxID=3453896 RepID=UPI003F878830